MLIFFLSRACATARALRLPNHIFDAKSLIYACKTTRCKCAPSALSSRALRWKISGSRQARGYGQTLAARQGAVRARHQRISRRSAPLRHKVSGALFDGKKRQRHHDLAALEVKGLGPSHSATSSSIKFRVERVEPCSVHMFYYIAHMTEETVLDSLQRGHLRAFFLASFCDNGP